jgi:hypothetical protein
MRIKLSEFPETAACRDNPVAVLSATPARLRAGMVATVTGLWSQLWSALNTT